MTRDAGSAGLVELRVRKTFAPPRAPRFELDVEVVLTPGVTTIVGATGAGKSTLLHCLAGLTRPDSGLIRVSGRTLFDSRRRVNLPSAERRVALVFQDLALFPHLDVGRNVGYGLRREPSAIRGRRVDALLEVFHIRHLKYRSVNRLSGGERQRVALARSLAVRPSMLLLDEALSSLDPTIKADIVDDLKAWNDEHRIPIVHVTHDRPEAIAIGERALVMEGGRVVRDGFPAQILAVDSVAGVGETDQVIDAVLIDVDRDRGIGFCQVSGTNLVLRVELHGAHPLLGTRIRLSLHAMSVGGRVGAARRESPVPAREEGIGVRRSLV